MVRAKTAFLSLDFLLFSNYPAVSYFAKKHVPLKHTLMLHKISLEKFEIF